jgi:hypothetical protein
MDALGAFELRLTRPDGATKRIPAATTRQEAHTLAQHYLDHDQAVRVEVWGWRHRRWELDGVIEPPKQPAEPESDPDALPAPEDDVVDVGDDVLEVDDDVLDIEAE